MIPSETTVTKLSPAPRSAAILAEIGHFFTSEGIQAYVVGGFLRDLALGRETADIDMTAAADALEIAPRLADTLGGSYVPLDEENKVARVVVAAKEAEHPSGPWQLDLTSFSGGIKQDLGRRDFTINAMAVDLSEICLPQTEGGGEVTVIDPFNGLGDLEKGVIRATSRTVFQEDPLRTLRAVRLAAELNFTIDAATEELIKSHGKLIANVAAERSREELVRLLELTTSERLWPYMDELGLLTALIPELEPTRGVAQPKEHTWDVLGHSIKTAAAVDFILRQGKWPYASEEVLDRVPWSPELSRYFARTVGGSTRGALTKLAALLHDIAKPQTRVMVAGGRIRFLGHASAGSAMTAQVLERLRFSQREANLVTIIVGYHLRPVQMSSPGELPSERAIYRYFRDCADAGIETLFLSLADHLATRGPELEAANWQHHAHLVEYALSRHNKQQERVAPAKLISGNDVIKQFNLKPGPKVGQVLEAVREALASGEISSREEALALAADVLKSTEDGH